MSVINRQGPEIVDENIEDVEFESQQLLKDIEKEFETLKMQDDHFEQDELIDDFSPEGEEEIEVKKSEWIWNLVAVIVFALIGVGAERAYTILSNKQVDLPEHLESLQEEEENLFADDSSNSEKAFHLRKALNAQNDYDREAVADLMDQELEELHEANENSYVDTTVVDSDPKEESRVEVVIGDKEPSKQESNFASISDVDEQKLKPKKKIAMKQQLPAKKQVEKKKLAVVKPKKKVKKLKKLASKKVRSKKLATKKAKKKTVVKPKFVRYMVIKEGSKLRRGPKKSYESVKRVSVGTTFLAETFDKQWVKVDFGQYIERARLYNLDNQAKKYEAAWINTKKLNVRARTTVKSKVLSTLVKADKISVTKVSDKWSAVKGGGFIYNKYLSSERVYPFDLPAVMKVDVNRANIRETPSTSASVVGQYYKGKPLKVHSIKNGWAKVGKFQFISVDLLKVMNAKGMVAKRSTKKKR